MTGDKQDVDAVVDVVISGCGPVGALTANLLGTLGVKTLVVERDATPHGEPRAFSCDDEALRIYQSTGLAELLSTGMRQAKLSEYVDGDGEPLARVDTGSADFGFGHKALWFFHQPLLERGLRQGLTRFAHVEVRLGTSVKGLEQDAEGVTVRCEDAATGATRRVRARYVLGCDGARSAVRKLLDIPLTGRAYEEPWLAVSGTVDEDLPAQCRFVCDPHRPTFVASGAARQLRWEFMLLPGETREQMEHPAMLAKLIAPYIDPRRVRINRAQVYTFHCLNAARWRDGRVFLLGDAAHTMPPFMGQGMVSGLRDASNLAWKLHRVLLGQASDALLDTYEQERRPHVESLQKLCVNVGHLFLARNRQVARVRDFVLRALQWIPRVRRYIERFEFKQPPSHGAGFYLGGGRSEHDAAQGTYFIQPRVRLSSGEEVLLDEALGNDFTVLCRADAPARQVEAARGLAESLHGRLVTVKSAGAASGEREDCEVVDITGKIRAWLQRNAADVVVLRPDRFVFGAVQEGRLPELRAALGV